MRVWERDGRIVYGARCTWTGTIDEIRSRDGIPTCPHCGGVLFEMTIKDFWQNAIRLDQMFPGYMTFMVWGYGKCTPDFDDLRHSYNELVEMSGGHLKEIPPMEELREMMHRPEAKEEKEDG